MRVHYLIRACLVIKYFINLPFACDRLRRGDPHDVLSNGRKVVDMSLDPSPLPLL